MKKIYASFILATAFMLVMSLGVLAVESDHKILNKWGLSGSFEAHSGYNWGGLLEEGATWNYSIQIKEAMSGDYSVGSIRFTSGDVEVIGHVKQTKSDYKYWGKQNLAAAGTAEYDGITYNFMFLFSERAMWFAISTEPLEDYWLLETVWPGSKRNYQLHSKVPDEGFLMDPKNIPRVNENGCTTIQDGVLTYSNSNEIIPIGYDKWGYNYQAHMFNGWYWNNARPESAYTKDTIDQAPSNTWLIMKWSDEWLANTDCNEDGKLDRGYACDPVNAGSSACEGAWLTNHQWGSYEQNGETCYWNYFVKMVHPGDDAYKVDGMWYTADGEKIGTVIWGAYARILQISNDPCADEHGVLNKWETPAGFGYYR